MTRRCRGGYTLLEVAACLVLLGVLAALAAVSLETARRRATWDDTMGRLQEADASARAQAAAFGRRVELVLDPERDEVVRRTRGEAGTAAKRWPLPENFDLVDAWVADEVVDREPTHALRQVSVMLGGDGLGSAYVLTLRDLRAEGQRESAVRRWLVTGAGQWLELDDEDDPKSILRGPDAG